MESNPNLRQFLIALFSAFMLFIPYEYYFRNVEAWPKSQDIESLDLWAQCRSKVKYLNSDDIIILGSSRAHFDINIHLWKDITGQRPLMLAYPGSSPFHTVDDIVNNTDFNGLLIVGVSPGLFFTVADSWGAGRGKKLIDYYNDATYAQRFSAFLYQQIKPHFASIGPDMSYESLIERIQLPNRDSVSDPDIWPPMVGMDKYRNVRMTPQMETDTVLQRRQTDIWDWPVWKNRYADSIDVILKHYVDLFQKHKAKGGELFLIRPPVTGNYLKYEPQLYPREKYWDVLLDSTGVKGFHFMDNPETNAMVPPEWSHLNRKDSDRFTEILINQLREEELIKN